VPRSVPILDEEQVRVAPSILSADFGELAAALASVEGETDWIHVDVMDGHFVPNLTIGPPVVRSLRPRSKSFFDCHLMMTNPGEYLEAFAAAGADLTTVHVEIGGTRELIAEMRRLGLGVGLALNPDTPFEAVEPFLREIDLLLVMSVFPGFGGQAFMAEVLPKLEAATAALLGATHRVHLEIDGGIDERTAPLAVAAGARVLVAGSAVFGTDDHAGAVRRITQAASGAI
jgi:ribulose-phosphate 3-epimerase